MMIKTSHVRSKLLKGSWDGWNSFYPNHAILYLLYIYIYMYIHIERDINI